MGKPIRVPCTQHAHFATSLFYDLLFDILTFVQDAEEALAHMLSSLREECSEYFASNQSSLAVATALSSRILTLERLVNFSVLERWTRSFLGPFNGIVGSVLTCQSCSFQVEWYFCFSFFFQ